MKCVNCEAEVPRLFSYPEEADPNVCGACQISLSGEFPGVNGVEHINSIDPAKPDPLKAMKLVLGDLQHSDRPDNKLNNKQAQFIYDVHKRDHERIQAAQHATPQRTVDRQREQIQQMTHDDLSAIEAGKRKARQELDKRQHFFNKLKEAARK